MVEKMESSLGPLDQTALLAVNILKSGTPKNLVYLSSKDKLVLNVVVKSSNASIPSASLGTF